MDNSKTFDREDRRRGPELAVRFGGAVTGVGLAAGVVAVVGADGTFPAWLSVFLLLIGITLLIVGYGARRQHQS